MGESESEDEFSDAFESHVDHENHEEQQPPDEFQEVRESHEDDTPDDPLRLRREREDKMTQEERESLKDQAMSLKDEGNKHYSSDENDEAATKYTEAIDICPLCYSNERAILFANRAAVHLKNDDKESAISDCTTAIELKPDYVKALIRRGQTYENSDKPHEAMKDFEKVLEIDPGHKDARFAVMRLPEKIRDKDERLKAEMLDNLKKLGDMVLRPFGLSTNNFSMVQDPNSGGYSINFNK